MVSPRARTRPLSAGLAVSAILLAVVSGCRSGQPQAAPSKGAATGSPSAGAHPGKPGKDPANTTTNSRVVEARGAAIGGCPMFPADNVWNADVSHLPVSSRSSAYIGSIGAGGSVHPDFGAGSWDGTTIGMPVTYVKGGQAPVKVSFDYADESDRVGYPIPPDVEVEGGQNADGDRHVLVVDTGTCKLYELYDAHRQGSSWHAGSGAVYDLRSNHLRPAGWTSADAAGLPVTPGLVRLGEVRAGKITHALRITVPRTAARYVWPARHSASSASDASLPPMGLRLRLKAGVSISGFPREDQVILRALKTYGAIVADNGSAWYISGTHEAGWNNDALNALGRIKGSDFEAVDTDSLMADRDSGRVRG